MYDSPHQAMEAEKTFLALLRSLDASTIMFQFYRGNREWPEAVEHQFQETLGHFEDAQNAFRNFLVDARNQANAMDPDTNVTGAL